MSRTLESHNATQQDEADRRHLPVIHAYSEGRTLEQVAEQFGLTKQRVSQIITRARKRGLL